ncbi:unnamed protein product [Effrenium voratum]|nr:unnamed protein product [Effrenium voratum]
MRSGMQLTAAVAFVSIWAEAAVIAEAAVVIPLTGQVVSAVNPEDHSLTKSPVYYGEVLVGQGKRSFQVLLDTGSSNLWLPSTSCSAVPCDLHRKYQPMRMANESEEADGLATSFATGQLVGFAVKDSFCLADLCARGSIMAAVQESYYPFTAMPFDGILGLGPTHDASSPLRALAEVGLDRFAFRLEAPIGGVNGEAAFGALPTHWINGPTEWVPLVPEAEEEGYWLVEVLAVPGAECCNPSEWPGHGRSLRHFLRTKRAGRPWKQHTQLNLKIPAWIAIIITTDAQLPGHSCFFPCGH